MKARPRVGNQYQQENAPGVAEDEARVRHLHRSVETPFQNFGDCLQTEEFTDLEPDVLEYKYYAPGIGLVKTLDAPAAARYRGWRMCNWRRRRSPV